jgi:hypothetical protein
MARVTTALYAIQSTVKAPGRPQQPRKDTSAMTLIMDPAIAGVLANSASERPNVLSWTEEESHNDTGALAAHRAGKIVLCGDLDLSFSTISRRLTPTSSILLR